MTALGEINANCDNWRHLSSEARIFCRQCVQPAARRRPTAEDALAHAFIAKAARVRRRDARGDRSAVYTIWDSLDGFQKLGWQAIAFATSEPDLFEAKIISSVGELTALYHTSGHTFSYIEALAMELAALVAPSWFSEAKWLETMRLAFRYLDVGLDGRLTTEDLTQHMYGSSTAVTAKLWLDRWRQGGELDFDCFRAALQQTAIWAETGGDAAGYRTGAERASDTGRHLHTISIDVAEEEELRTTTTSPLTAGAHDDDEHERSAVPL